MLTRYKVGLIAIVLVSVYVLSFVLYKTGVIRVATHRKIWNVLLLVTFLSAGTLGLMLAIRIDYVVTTPVRINLIFWHVEAGVAMTLLSLFHLTWHLKYYRDLLRRHRERVVEAEAAECMNGDDEAPSR